MLACSLILLGSLACLGTAHPIESDMEPHLVLREKRSPIPAGTMILVRGHPSAGGYHYNRPERAFNPRATMTSRLYHGAATETEKHSCGHCRQLVDEHPHTRHPEEEEEPKALQHPVHEEAPEDEHRRKGAAPERKPKAPKAPPKRTPVEDEDEDEEVSPRKEGKRGGSVYRDFFPITFGSAGRSGLRSSDGEGGAGQRGYGPVTAIANSFSKGRGAIASSSAVAYGHPGAGHNKQSQASRYGA